MAKTRVKFEDLQYGDYIVIFGEESLNVYHVIAKTDTSVTINLWCNHYSTSNTSTPEVMVITEDKKRLYVFYRLDEAEIDEHQ